MEGLAGSRRNNRRIRLDLIRTALCVLLVIAGCLGTPSRQPTETKTPIAAAHSGTETGDSTPTKHPKLESVLVRLVGAENRSTFAEEHGLELRDERVLVVIELRSGQELPDGYQIDVQARHGDDVQAYVAVDDLPAVAGHGDVSFVRAPQSAVEHDTNQ